VRGSIDKKQRNEAGLLRVSATRDLDPFRKCPASWFYQRILGIESFSLEAQLLDDKSLGLLYHEILHKLFAKIREEDHIFKSENIQTYYSWVNQYTNEAAQNYQAFKGPLAAPILISQADAIARRLRTLLKTEAGYFDHFTIGELEFRLESELDGMLCGGIIDRVSISPDDGPVIIDYKTGGTHTAKASTETEESGIRDFQIPLYVKLYEEKTGHRVEGAFFMIITRNEQIAVLGKHGGRQGQSREEYQETLDALNVYLEKFKTAVENLDFSSPEISLKDCMDCPYRNICRTVFFLNAGVSHVH
jgi:ATP-dependent helicase/DNAse subunit B